MMAEDRAPALDRHVQKELGAKLREGLAATEHEHMPVLIESLMARLRGIDIQADRHGQ
jgi:hypothetical protein